MPRDVTLTFDDGSSHIYNNVPDAVTPEQITARAGKEYAGRTVKHIDGNKKGNVMDVVKGAGDAALTLAGSAAGETVKSVGRLGTALAGSSDFSKAEKVGDLLEYQPKTDEGKAMLTKLGQLLQPISNAEHKVGEVADKALGAGTSKLAGDVMSVLPLAGAEKALMKGGKAATAAADAASVAAKTAKTQEYVEKTLGMKWDELSDKAKETVTSITNDAKDLTKLDPTAVKRQITLNTLDKPITSVTKGQLSRDEETLRKESLAAGTKGGEELRDIHDKQNQDLLDNLNILKGKQGGTAASVTEVGRSVQDKALRAKAAASKANYNSLYKRAEETESDVKMSSKPLHDMLDENPSAQHLDFMKTWLAKTKDIAGTKRNPAVTLKELYDLRKKATKLAKVGGTDGYYAGEVRDSIDKMMQEGAPEGAKAWRAANDAFKAHHQEFTNQGAVKKLVADKKNMSDRSTALEKTWKSTVIDGSEEDLKKVQKSLLEGGTEGTREAGRQAWNDIKSHTVQHIIDEAANKNVARTQTGARNLTPASLKRAIDNIGRPKLEILLGKDGADKLHQILDSAEILKTEPPGSHKGSSTVANILALLSHKIPGVGGMVGHGIKNLAEGAEARQTVRSATKGTTVRSAEDIAKSDAKAKTAAKRKKLAAAGAVGAADAARYQYNASDYSEN